MPRQSRKDFQEALKDVNAGCILMLIGVPGSFILIVAILFIAIGFREIYRQERLLTSAVPVEAVIQAKRVETSTSSTGTGTSRARHTIYIPIVEYTYTYEEQTHMGERLWPTPRSMNNSGDARAAIAPYVLGRSVTAYIDPDEPATAFLLKQWSAGPYLAVSVAPPLIACAVAFGILLAGYRNLFRAWIAVFASVTLTACTGVIAASHYFAHFEPVAMGPALAVIGVSALVSLAPLAAFLKARSLRRILVSDA